MSAGSLTPAERTKLVGILGRLGCDYEGERAAAGLLASRMLRAKGLTWPDVVLPRLPHPDCAPPEPGPDWRADVAECLQHLDWLTEWEKRFVASIHERRWLSRKQRARLSEISAKVAARKSA